LPTSGGGVVQIHGVDAERTRSLGAVGAVEWLVAHTAACNMLIPQLVHISVIKVRDLSFTATYAIARALLLGIAGTRSALASGALEAV
jgi:hypothetical protein